MSAAAAHAAAAAGTDAAAASGLPPCPPWDSLPEVAALAILHYLTQGHAAVSRLVCRTWRDTLDSQATHTTLLTWPSPPKGRVPPPPVQGPGPAAPVAAAGAAAALPAPAPAGPRRPLHVVAPNAGSVDLSLLPPDEVGGRLGGLLEDLAQLSGLTRLTLCWSAIAVRESAIANAAAPLDRAGGGERAQQHGRPRQHEGLRVFAVSYGHRLDLPDCISKLTGLKELSLLGPSDDRPPHPALVAHPGAALPAALGALGAAGLRALCVEGLVLPRRQLAQMTALSRLALAGWDAVTKMAVHLHKLRALSDLELSLECDDPDPGAAGHLLRCLLIEIARMPPLRRLALLWGPVLLPAGLSAAAADALEAACASHGRRLEALRLDVVQGPAPAVASAIAALRHLSQLRSLQLSRVPPLPPPPRGAGRGAAAPARLLPEGLTALTSLAWAWAPELAPNGGRRGAGRRAGAPVGLGDPPHLHELHLEGACMDLGTLPPDLGACTALRILSVVDGRLQQLPSWVSELQHLQELALDGNPLRGLPPWLPALSALTRLSCECCSLGSIPEQLRRMPGLRTLSIGENDMRGGAEGGAVAALSQGARAPAPGEQQQHGQDRSSKSGGGGGISMGAASFKSGLARVGGRLAGCIVADGCRAAPAPAGEDGAVAALGESAASGAAASWAAASGAAADGCCAVGLHELDLSGLRLTAPDRSALAPWFCRLRWLRVLKAGRCGLEKVPDGLPAGLEVLDLSRNQILSLPVDLGRLVNLELLDVSCNRRLKRLPDGITRLHSLSELDASSCALEHLPQGMGSMLCLQELNASRNVPLRELPECLGACPMLRTLRLAGCGLPALPPAWGRGAGDGAGDRGPAARSAEAAAAAIKGGGQVLGGGGGGSVSGGVLPALVLLHVCIELRDDPAVAALRARGVATVQQGGRRDAGSGDEEEEEEDEWREEEVGEEADGWESDG